MFVQRNIRRIMTVGVDWLEYAFYNILNFEPC